MGLGTCDCEGYHRRKRASVRHQPVVYITTQLVGMQIKKQKDKNAADLSPPPAIQLFVVQHTPVVSHQFFFASVPHAPVCIIKAFGAHTHHASHDCHVLR